MNMRRLAGISGIHPVDMPAGFELEVKPGVIRLIAAIQLVPRRQQLNLEMRRVSRGRCS